jgi:general secretion pathway protein N
MRGLLALGFVLAFVAAAVAFLPLAAALRWSGVERRGLSAASATGTVWRGELKDARYGGVNLGDVMVGLDAAALLGGRLRLRTASESGAFRGAAAWVLNGRDAGLEAATGELAPSVLRTPLPLSGPVRFGDVFIRFRGGRCAAAGGRVDVASAAGALSGPLRCANGALNLPLQGRTAAGETRLAVTLQGDGRYRVEGRVLAPEPAAAASLRLAGFADVDGAMQRSTEGRLDFGQPSPTGP